jgi:hypothetical protein
MCMMDKSLQKQAHKVASEPGAQVWGMGSIALL